MAEDATVAPALTPIAVDGATCLEAGAGAGNTSEALTDRGAREVYAVTNDRKHVRTVTARFSDEATVRPLLADLRSLPLPTDAVRVTTAHALFNVVSPADLSDVIAEVTRVTEPGGWLAVVDYEPIENDTVSDLFALENAASLLADGETAMTFYPSAHVEALLTGFGWTRIDAGTALEPVPWTAELLDAHADLTRSDLDRLGDAGEALDERLATVRERAGEQVTCGSMYYQTFRLEK